MPVKIWNEPRPGERLSAIETNRPSALGGEEYRAQAEALDLEIDRMLDHATALASRSLGSSGSRFVKRWSVGRALSESLLIESPNLDPSEHKLLWKALAHKCRLGVRADGNSEPQWLDLIHGRATDPQRIERDVFAMGRWLQEQDLDKALLTMGGNLGNAVELQRREATRGIEMRNALCRWMSERQREGRLEQFTNRKQFVEIAKALSARWPSRGPGSAKRPIHYSEDDLYQEVSLNLEPFLTK